MAGAETPTAHHQTSVSQLAGSHETRVGLCRPPRLGRSIAVLPGTAAAAIIDALIADASR